LNCPSQISLVEEVTIPAKSLPKANDLTTILCLYPLPLTSPGSPSILSRLTLLNSELTVAVGEIAAEHQISAAQFAVLRVLIESWPDPLTCSDIGCNLLDRTPDVTRLLDRLDKAGLIDRKRCTEDRRVTHVHLSTEGKSRTIAVVEQVNRFERHLIDRLSTEEQRLLTHLLDRIRL